MKIVIIGMGEVGSAHYELLKDIASVHGEDINPAKQRNALDISDELKCDYLIIATRYSDNFKQTVIDYASRFRPEIIINCTTVPVGTTEAIMKETHIRAVHSTTRGLHPNLTSGLTAITKHIGGPRSATVQVASTFNQVGIPIEIHDSSKTTELAHILNNIHYGINLMAADTFQQLCRHYGVDYYQAVMKYTESNNEGYRRLDNASKVRPILTPPNGSIGGHCVVQSAEFIPEEIRNSLIKNLVNYNNASNLLSFGSNNEIIEARKAYQQSGGVPFEQAEIGPPSETQVSVANKERKSKYKRGK